RRHAGDPENSGGPGGRRIIREGPSRRCDAAPEAVWTAAFRRRRGEDGPDRSAHGHLRRRRQPGQRRLRDGVVKLQLLPVRAASTFTGVNGTWRRRAPVASNTALPIAAATLVIVH